MDPLLEFCRRDSLTYPYLKYDSSFVYNKDSVDFTLEEVKDRDFRDYVDAKLLTFFKKISSEAIISSGEQIVLEWANPLTSVHGYLKEGEDFNLKVLKRIFGLSHVISVIPDFFSPADIFKLHFLKGTPPDNMIIRCPEILDSYWVHFVYLMSKLYRKVTLLQPICLKYRHLICLQYVGDAKITNQDLLELSVKSSIGEKIYGIFRDLPEGFVSWITFMNNTHLETRCEFLIHVVEARTAFAGGSFYWSGVSYDVLKAVKFITGIPTDPKVDIPPGLKFLKDVDHVIATSMHLYGKGEDFSGRPLHEIIDLEKDDRMPYEPLKGRRIGGLGWSHRKILMSDLNFITSKLDPEEEALVIYIGAVPWKHGPLLMNSFPKARFVLFDQRENDWDQKVKNVAAVETSRLILRSETPDEELAEEVASWFNAEYEGDMKYFVTDVKKILILSDIRKVAHQDSGFVAGEFGMDEDMRTQKQFVEKIYVGLQEIGISISSCLRFRLPFITEIGGMEYSYGKGELHTQPWAPVGSTELRLWWNPEEGETTYNKSSVEQIMMFHNHKIRSADYGKPDSASYCQCHDCHYEIQIISRFLSKFKGNNLKTGTEIFNLFVNSEVVEALEQTLSSYSNINRQNVSVPKPIWDFTQAEGAKKKTLRYDPVIENLISAATARLKNQWRLFLEKQPGQKGRDVSKMLDDFLILQLFLFGGFMPYNLEEEEKTDLLTEFFNIKENKKETVEKLVEILQEVEKSYYKDLDEYKSSDRYGVPVSSKLHKLNKGGFFKLDSDKVGTIGFHKSFLRRFLIPSELEMNISDKIMKDLHESVLPRAYCLLKRYGAVQNPHFYTYPSELLEKNPVLRDGNILGLSTLSGKRNERYMLLTRKLDFYFNDDKYLNILLGEREDKEKILDRPTLLVFLPEISLLWIRAMEIILSILSKYENEDRTVVLLGNKSILEENDTFLGMIKEFKTFGAAYEGLFLNTLTDSPFRSESQHIIVLGTRHSTFQLKN